MHLKEKFFEFEDNVRLEINYRTVHKKLNLPSKICITCKLPFTWRKKWERDWENVKYCSKRCQSQTKK